MTDYRTAGDLKLTKYLDGYALAVTGAYSHERDYISRATGFEARTWTPDKNRTYALGMGFAADRIHPTDRPFDNGSRDTLDFLFGVTQVLSANAIVQSNFTYATGHGYYSDPYKPGDRRPDHRRTFAWLTRYNQYVRRSTGRSGFSIASSTIRSATSRTRSRSLGRSRCAAGGRSRPACAITRRATPASISVRHSATDSNSVSPTRATRGCRRSAR